MQGTKAQTTGTGAAQSESSQSLQTRLYLNTNKGPVYTGSLERFGEEFVGHDQNGKEVRCKWDEISSISTYQSQSEEYPQGEGNSNALKTGADVVEQNQRIANEKTGTQQNQPAPGQRR